MVETVKMGARGTFVIPARLRKELGMEEGSLLILEQTDRGFLVRPAAAMPVEIFTARRKAEFMLNNAVDAESYAEARELAIQWGVDPDTIEHDLPPGVAR